MDLTTDILNALIAFWLLSSVAIFIAHVLMTVTSNCGLMGQSIRAFSLFGKLKQAEDKKNGKSNVKRLLDYRDGQQAGNKSSSSLVAVPVVPKRWFSHFYAVGALVHSVVLLSCLPAVLLGSPPPYAIRHITYWIRLGSEQHSLSRNALPLLIVLCLEFVQMLRRLYECLFISTFSKSSMNIVHYFYGIFLYSSFGIGLLSSMNLEKLAFSAVSSAEVVSYFLGVSLFSWGSYYQHKSMLTFASLRKDQKGHRPSDHHLPRGHLFEWVSCPHYLCEILIYLAFCIIFQFSNLYVLSVATFVLTNQACCSILVHKWYQNNFPNYPKLRTAVVPYIL